MGKIWLKSVDPNRQCCGCEGKTSPCDSCCAFILNENTTYNSKADAITALQDGLNQCVFYIENINNDELSFTISSDRKIAEIISNFPTNASITECSSIPKDDTLEITVSRTAESSKTESNNNIEINCDTKTIKVYKYSGDIMDIGVDIRTISGDYTIIEDTTTEEKPEDYDDFTEYSLIPQTKTNTDTYLIGRRILQNPDNTDPDKQSFDYVSWKEISADQYNWLLGAPQSELSGFASSISDFITYESWAGSGYFSISANLSVADIIEIGTIPPATPSNPNPVAPSITKRVLNISYTVHFTNTDTAGAAGGSVIFYDSNGNTLFIIGIGGVERGKTLSKTGDFSINIPNDCSGEYSYFTSVGTTIAFTGYFLASSIPRRLFIPDDFCSCWGLSSNGDNVINLTNPLNGYCKSYINDIIDVSELFDICNSVTSNIGDDIIEATNTFYVAKSILTETAWTVPIIKPSEVIAIPTTRILKLKASSNTCIYINVTDYAGIEFNDPSISINLKSNGKNLIVGSAYYNNNNVKSLIRCS